MKTLSELFDRCLNISYTDIDSVSFATELDGDALTLYFEGSRGGIDWVRNIDFPAEPYREMQPSWRAHRGFIRAWKYVSPYLEKFRDDTSIKKVTVVGYSHGAALAVFAHEDFYFHRPDIRSSIHGIGFAPPRVVAENPLPPELAERWQNFTTVWNIGDIVPTLPPDLFGYSHVGKLLAIGEIGKYNPIDAHKPESYIEELKKCKRGGRI